MALVACAAGLCVLGGCYERVIKAHGLGADHLAVQKPYASNTALDNALMGPPPDPSGRKKIKAAHWEPAGK